MRREKKLWLFVSLILIPFYFLLAQGSQKSRQNDQYRAVHWSVEEGLPSDIANVMLKDTKGFLWIGSNTGGLCRFEGSLFKKYFSDNKPGSIHSDHVLSFVEDSLKNIWVGTTKCLSRYDLKADTFTNISAISDTSNLNSEVRPFWATKEEILCIESDEWITSYNIHSLKGKRLQKISKETEYIVYRVVYEEATNCIWLRHMETNVEGTLVKLNLTNGQREIYKWPCYKNHSSPHRHDFEAILLDKKRNSLWLNTGDGLFQFSLADKKFKHIDALNHLISLPDFDRDVGIELDNRGRIWLATKPWGIFIYDPETNSVEQLFSDPVLQKKTGTSNLYIYSTPEGIVWTSYWLQYGVYEMIPSNPLLKRFNAKPGSKDSLSNSKIFSMWPGPGGTIWIGTDDGLNIYDPVNSRFSVLRGKDIGLNARIIVPMYVDTVRKKAWLIAEPKNLLYTTHYHLYEMDLSTMKCVPVLYRNGTKILDSVTLTPTFAHPYQNGLLFLSDRSGVFEIKENSLFADLVIPISTLSSRAELVNDSLLFIKAWAVSPNYFFVMKNKKWVRTPNALDYVDWHLLYYNKNDQTYWVSTPNELIHYDKNFSTIKKIQEQEGYTGVLYNMQSDSKGGLWFVNMVRKVSHLDPHTNIITILSDKDGFEKQDFDYYSTGTKDVYGNIYFAPNIPNNFAGGLNVISPSKFLSSVTSMPYVRTLFINRNPFSSGADINNLEQLSLKHNQNNIRFETGIIDFIAKGQGHIRYKLEKNGDKADWQYGSAYFTISYEGLPPGSYVLILQASNANNEFNSPEKILTIKISPPWWETWWFRILSVIAMVFVVYAIVQQQSRVLKKRNLILEEKVKERTAEVVEEKAEVEKQKAKSDELLLNILPSEVAEELKEKGYTTAKAFDEVTILFSDIKGFTHVAEKLTAQELVKEIDIYFRAFDSVMLKYGLEKIKTIGDAYIAAGGLPEKNSATAENVVLAAIAMQQAVENFKLERTSVDKPYFELRIGIHTGPVVAGVVGIKKFQYDVWGDAVNLAARMEQSGIPGKINISQQTFEIVKDKFNCVHRGKVEAKNKGSIDMYFVES